MPTFPTSRTWGRGFQRYFPAATRRWSAVASDGQQRQGWATCWGLPAWVLWGRITVGALLIAFVMLAWPVGVGSREDEDVTPLAFSVFMALYTIIELPTLALQLEFSLGLLSWPVRIGVMLVGQGAIQGVLLAELKSWSVGSIKVARTSGSFIYCGVLYVVYIVLTLLRADPLDRALINPTRAGVNTEERTQLLNDSAARRGADADGSSPTSSASSVPDEALDSQVTVHSRAYVDVEGDTEGQFARLAAFEDTSFARLKSDQRFAEPAGSPVDATALLRSHSPGTTNERLQSQTPAAAVPASAEDITFTADTSSDLFSAGSVSRLFAPVFRAGSLDAIDRPTLLDMERTYCAIQLRCPRSAWYLQSWARPPLTMLLAAFASDLTMLGIYVFVQWCAIALFIDKDHTHEPSVGSSLRRYCIFASAVICGGFVTKRFARAADALKTVAFARAKFPAAIVALRTGGTLPPSVLDPTLDDHGEGDHRTGARGLEGARFLSMEMSQHILVCYFFAIFFRVLFQQLESWEQFTAVSVVHLAVVAAGYPLRMTRVYFRVTDALQQRCKGVPLLGFLYDPSNGAQWNTRIAVDFMVHFSTAVTATVAFLAATAFLRFSYNRGRYRFFGSQLSDEDFETGMVFVAASAAVEVASAVIMVLCTRGLVRGGIGAPMTQLMRAVPPYQWFLLFAGGHVITDVFLAHVRLGPAVPPD